MCPASLKWVSVDTLWFCASYIWIDWKQTQIHYVITPVKPDLDLLLFYNHMFSESGFYNLCLALAWWNVCIRKDLRCNFKHQIYSWKKAWAIYKFMFTEIATKFHTCLHSTAAMSCTLKCLSNLVCSEKVFEMDPWYVFLTLTLSCSVYLYLCLRLICLSLSLYLCVL